MSRLVSIAVWIGVVLLIVATTHYYIWARLVRDTSVDPPWRGVATTGLATLALSIPGAMVWRWSFGRHSADAVVWTAYVWLGVWFALLTALWLTDIVRLGLKAAEWLSSDGVAHDSGRRLFLARVLGGTAIGYAGLATAWGVRAALQPPPRKDVEVKLKRLPRAMDGTTIVQITDLHVGPTIGRDVVQDLVARTNSLSPDIVAITGDLVDGSVAHLRDAVAPLGELRARHGVYFVTGNHEYYSGVEPWVQELGRLGLRVLRNECVRIGEGDACFELAGVDDYSARHAGNGAARVAHALAGRDRNLELVLLAHQPRHIYEAVEHGVGLQLSGHTHGGQIWPFGLLVRLVQPYVVGLARHGDTQIYVSAGTGYWGPPMRLGAPAELTHITLRSA